MKPLGNILEAIILLRIARDKLEDEAHWIGRNQIDKYILVRDQASAIDPILEQLEQEFGVP